MITFHIITIFPEMFTSYTSESILGRAIKQKNIAIKFYPLRDFVKGKYRKVWPDGNISAQVDDKPYGGGPGMILRAEPILEAVKKAKGKKKHVKIIMTSAGGSHFSNEYAQKIIHQEKVKDIIIICGRYEGIDSRVQEALQAEEISIGDYILTGGELPAMVMMDAISRHVPGVLGKMESIEENRISSHEMYTRPESLSWGKKKYTVPAVLLSGNHKDIDDWRSKE
jgi:tRNA (guanine37-N1)-methyltransferase